MTDWRTAIEQGIRELGLEPDESQLITCQPMSKEMGQLLANIINQCPRIESLDRQKGLTIENPLMTDDPNYQQQYKFCMTYFGRCYITEGNK